jgi:phospholipase D1/2
MSFENFEYPDRNASLNAVAFDGDTRQAKGVATQFGDMRRQRLADTSFAPERFGNQAKAFTTGEEYFTDVYDKIVAAKKSVFIIGWQVNWAVKLKGELRLIDALKAAVDNGAKVYVMPWLSPKVGVNTGDFGTMLAVFSLNAGREEIAAFCCPAGLQNDYSGVEETFFSHHQKLVVVDNTFAYVGGIDLAFGRRDDASFALAHGWRTGPEVYNTGVPPMQPEPPGRMANYLEESELLNTTLTTTVLNTISQLQNQASNAVYGGRYSPVRWAVDGVHSWWHSPAPGWLLSAKEWAAETSASVTDFATRGMAEAASRRIDQVKQTATDEAVVELKSGRVTEGNVTQLISLAKQIVQTAYAGLVQAQWKMKQVNRELLTPGRQSTPNGGKSYWPRQPRMPWQDVHVRIEGPSVYDLSMNFIRRWNSLQSKLDARVAKKASIGTALFPAVPATGEGNGGQGGMKVDVLRSASIQLQNDEARATPGLRRPSGPQREIHDAMVSAILNAERFIYIENQFFQSGFGEASINPNNRRLESGPMRYLRAIPGNRIQAAVTHVGAAHANQLPRNHIARAIADRIEDAIRWDQPFHAYLVLPVHPEGGLADLAIVGQIHWTMQSLVYARESLVNRVRLAIYARRNCKNPLDRGEWEAAKRKGSQAGLDDEDKKTPQSEIEVPVQHVATYLTLLNLRSCQTVDGAPCTEQAYVHSKLLIVDDTLAIIGSANINDRSLHGGRDSELAVCITDLATKRAPIDGKNPLVVRTFAHELRKSLWAKHFGLRGGTDLIKPASQLAGLLDKPADPATWQAIQRVAAANAAQYAQTFRWTPSADPGKASSIWPVWDHGKQPTGGTHYDATKQLQPFADKMPFSEAFWQRKFDGRAPQNLQGFICALPVAWTKDENNHPEMNTILLTDRGDPSPGGVSVAQGHAARNSELPA